MKKDIDLELLAEGPRIELKAAEKGLPKSLWESYSAFANVSGGTIYLGIVEKKPKNIIIGVSEPDKKKQDLLNLANDKNNVNVDLLSDDSISFIDWGGKQVMAILVPEAPIREKPVYLHGNIKNSYKRGGEGDELMGENEVKAKLIDADGSNFDQKPNNIEVKVGDLCKDSILAYRSAYHSHSPSSSFNNYDDVAFLKFVGALRRDETGEFVPTNGAVALFGYVADIKEIYPCYRLDFFDEGNIREKWGKRIGSEDFTWSGNLFDFLGLVEDYLVPRLPNDYRVGSLANEGGTREQEILREGVLNAFFNADFFLLGGIKIKATPFVITIKNSGRMRVGIEQALRGGVSDNRNDGIATMLRAIGYGEKAGSGIPTMFQKAKECGYPSPALGQEAFPYEETSLTLFFQKADASQPESISSLLSFLSTNGPSSAKEIMEGCHFSRNKTFATINHLLKSKLIIDNGKETNGKKYLIP